MTGSRQARTIEEFFEISSALHSEDGMAYAKSFKPRTSDILIATFPKAGTTWMQQICHGLRTKGDMSFDEITHVVPWIEMAHTLNLDINADQVAGPRCFKSHDNWHDIAKGGRYICVIRNPFDSAVSMYNFMNGWFLEKDAIALNDFVAATFVTGYQQRGYWQHLISWWQQRNNPDVLFVTYEGMKENLSFEVRRVAEFMGIDDTEAINIATKQAAFEFMNAHNRQFDDHIVADVINSRAGLPANAGTSKVQPGTVDGNQQVLSSDNRQLLNTIWKETIEKHLGFLSYEKLTAKLRHSAQ